MNQCSYRFMVQEFLLLHEGLLSPAQLKIIVAGAW